MNSTICEGSDPVYIQNFCLGRVVGVKPSAFCENAYIFFIQIFRNYFRWFLIFLNLKNAILRLTYWR